MRRSPFVLSLSLVFVFVFVSTSPSEYYTTQLTNNENYDEGPVPSENGHVVWHRCDGTMGPWGCEGDYEIFLYNGTSTTQLTYNAYDDWYPQINDDGYVVWWGTDGLDDEIFLYDGATTLQLSNNDYHDQFPLISDDGHVVWQLCDGPYCYGPYEDDWEILLATPCSDDDGDGYYLEIGCPEPLDCNDADTGVYPGAPELCDGLDNQCPGDPGDGQVDEGCSTQCSGNVAFASYQASPGYGSSDLGRLLAYLLPPVGIILAVGFWRRKRKVGDSEHVNS